MRIRSFRDKLKTTIYAVCPHRLRRLFDYRSMYAAIDDTQVLNLIPACQRGDAGAIEGLYDLYADRIYHYVLARTGDVSAAEDLTAEVFLRVIQHVQRFKLDRTRPSSSVSAWLYRIAANLVTDFHRLRQRRPTVSIEDDALIDLDGAGSFSAGRTEGCVGKALRRIGETDRGSAAGGCVQIQRRHEQRAGCGLLGQNGGGDRGAATPGAADPLSFARRKQDADEREEADRHPEPLSGRDRGRRDRRRLSGAVSRIRRGTAPAAGDGRRAGDDKPVPRERRGTAAR